MAIVLPNKPRGRGEADCDFSFDLRFQPLSIPCSSKKDFSWQKLASFRENNKTDSCEQTIQEAKLQGLCEGRASA